jgi:hypothetical protein
MLAASVSRVSEAHCAWLASQALPPSVLDKGKPVARLGRKAKGRMAKTPLRWPGYRKDDGTESKQVTIDTGRSEEEVFIVFSPIGFQRPQRRQELPPGSFAFGGTLIPGPGSEGTRVVFLSAAPSGGC